MLEVEPIGHCGCMVTGRAETATKASPVPLKKHTHTHTHTVVLLLFWNLSGNTRVSRYQKGKNQEGKTNLDLLEQEIVFGSGIC